MEPGSYPSTEERGAMDRMEQVVEIRTDSFARTFFAVHKLLKKEIREGIRLRHSLQADIELRNIIPGIVDIDERKTVRTDVRSEYGRRADAEMTTTLGQFQKVWDQCISLGHSFPLVEWQRE